VMATLYKVLDPGGRCRNGGTGTWHLPKGNRPGKWMPRVPNPVACERGYHVCTALQLLTGNWLGPEIWIVEVRGAADYSANDKSCHEQARIIAPTQWNETTARLFAADCAEHVLPIFERERPGDMRPRECIAVARRFALGDATADEKDAAWDAAWDAVRDAAEDAAWNAAWAASGAASGAAAWNAARDAAWNAARAAAGDAERRWQARRLQSYLTGRRGKEGA
jgi:hypothetical protein